MKKRYFSLFFLVFSFFLIANRCQKSNEKLVLGEIPFPLDNPITAVKVSFGKKLFFDKRLSGDNTISCATCHIPEKAFTDGVPVSLGVSGLLSMRNAPSLLNTAYLPKIMFDAELKTLEMQVIVPIQEHVEMNQNIPDLLKELRSDTIYQRLAKEIFGREFDAFVLTRAIATFERSLISQNSAFDKFIAGNKTALTSEQQKGWKLFSEKLYCTKCHSAPHFTTYLPENNGLYLYYGIDKGRFRINEKEEEIGKFKVPSLRNISLTAPYMHDGSLKTLSEVIEHYSKGGNKHVNQSVIIQPFILSSQEKKEIISFLESLVDTTYLKELRKF